MTREGLAMLVKPGTRVSLKDYDPADTGPYRSEEEVQGRLEDLCHEMAKLQSVFYADRRFALLIILQGMDASGKDGTIKHVMSGLNPLGIRVVAFKAPTDEELRHDFLWRVHKVAPGHGDIGIFNRSHYEDVLVVRVHQLVPRKVWKKRYKQINHFEAILARNNTVLLKFFLHISKDEQKKRLQERLQDPSHYWKFSRQDVEERRFWSDYQEAYEDALSKCSTDRAPWHVVPANHKWYRNLVVAQTVVDTLKGLKLRYPEPPEDVAYIVIE
jgi:PPK2 family polyphosphate:nucleotide phosphotransferase